MPAKVIKKGNRYQVRTPSAIHAKGTTLSKAKGQQRLLNAIEHGFSMGRTGKKKKYLENM